MNYDGAASVHIGHLTGGAGYIGIHTVLQLLLEGHKTMIVDNFDNSSQVAINRVQKLAGDYGRNLSFQKMDIQNKNALEELFSSTNFSLTLRCAYSLRESSTQPPLSLNMPTNVTQQPSELLKLLDEDPTIMERRSSITKRLELYKSAQMEINGVSW